MHNQQHHGGEIIGEIVPFMSDADFAKVLYILVAFAAVGVSSLLNWKTAGEGEAFDWQKFLSAYLRTFWAIIPLSLGMASLGISVEGILAIAGTAMGIDNTVAAAKNLGKKSNGEATETKPQESTNTTTTPG